MITLGLTIPGNEHSPLQAHGHSLRNRIELEASPLCGCFYCLAIYPPTEIDLWIDEDRTAVCARCGIDSVIGSAAGFPLTPEFLSRMNHHWF